MTKCGEIVNYGDHLSTLPASASAGRLTQSNPSPHFSQRMLSRLGIARFPRRSATKLVRIVTRDQPRVLAFLDLRPLLLHAVTDLAFLIPMGDQL